MRRTIKNPASASNKHQMMQHLQQNKGDKPSTILHSERSTKLGGGPTSQQQPPQNAGSTSSNQINEDGNNNYQSSSAAQMMQSVQQYRSGAMGGQGGPAPSSKNVAMS